MNILFVVWELDPFFKIGGLGDVARSLPEALKKLDIDIRTVLPYYKVVKMGRNKKTKRAEFSLPYAGKTEKVEIWETIHPYTKVITYFLKNKAYLDTVLYMDTWGFFDTAVVHILEHKIINWNADILHLNDVHCGMIPLLVRQKHLPVKTIFTIHNLAYQGKTSAKTIDHMGIDIKTCTTIPWEIDANKINFLLEGLIHSDRITTVSPTYAKEIMTEEYGCGLTEYLKGLEGRVSGILNGINVDWRNTTHDIQVKYAYGPNKKMEDGKIQYYDWKEGKALNKRFLQKKLGLKVSAEIPLFSFIGRFDAAQKGIDMLHTVLRRMNQEKIECVILGSGNKDWEERFAWFSAFYPKNISCNFIFDDDLAHQIYAGSDFIVIPSRFEPCGLIQMIAMLFGTVPIAHSTGGLKDSITDGENGFLYETYDSKTLEDTMVKAMTLREKKRDVFEKIIQNALAMDFSWTKSAKEYIALYQRILTETP